ncbi:MAG: hypothetical protein JRI80_17190 [Deltaproteobacteria bacterium]|nr:hypothetical protein [Deltaproteobacteria bacterium]
MGLNLQTIHFNEWLYSIEDAELPKLKSELEEKLGVLPEDDSLTLDKSFPRVGSYAAYGIFRYCLVYITIGDYEKDLEPDEDYELTALKKFREHLPAGSHNIPTAIHFIETGDTDTIFLPISFDKPFEFYERFVASLPMATKALEDFASVLDFDLNSDFDNEYVNDEWQPLSTSRNIARIIYQFFKKNSNSCIEFS